RSWKTYSEACLRIWSLFIGVGGKSNWNIGDLSAISSSPEGVLGGGRRRAVDKIRPNAINYSPRGACPHLPGPRDVIFELFDRDLLFRDDGLHDAADGNHPDEAPLLHDREVADALRRHESHALFDRVIGTDDERIRRHDLTYTRLFRRLPLEDHFAGVIALG